MLCALVVCHRAWAESESVLIACTISAPHALGKAWARATFAFCIACENVVLDIELRGTEYFQQIRTNMEQGN